MLPTGCSKNPKVSSVLLIGLGNIGIGYDVHDGGFIVGQTMTHAKALLESTDFEFTSFTDESMKRLTNAQRIIQRTNIYNDKTSLIGFTPDLVVIAVSTPQHASVVNSLLVPPKFLVLEKPGGSNSIECSRISSWGVENNVQIFINYFRRYLSSSVNARLHFSNLQAGKFLSAEINAYGALLNIHSHFIDLGYFLTKRQIFCGCANKLSSQKGDVLTASCEVCNVTFRLAGINGLRQDISMTLEFENVRVLVEDDGKSIRVIDKIKKLSTLFESEFAEYKNYQKVVYEKIGAMLRLGESEKCYLGLAEANMVHLFLESVDFKNEK